MHTFHFVDLTSFQGNIFQQLQLEEALLRADERNWLIVRRGCPLSIVMGISGKPEELLVTDQVQRDGIPVIKRFSGGGTVIVDDNTLFVTLIGNHEVLDCPPFPCPIMRWTEDLYSPLLGPHGFRLRENDYALQDKKCGGNAQSLIRKRWLHHTSFLWDFAEENMRYLQIPKRAPEYREGRDHTEFLTTLKQCLNRPEELFEAVRDSLEERFEVVDYEIPDGLLERPHRQATQELLLV